MEFVIEIVNMTTFLTYNGYNDIIIQIVVKLLKVKEDVW